MQGSRKLKVLARILLSPHKITSFLSGIEYGTKSSVVLPSDGNRFRFCTNSSLDKDLCMIVQTEEA